MSVEPIPTGGGAVERPQATRQRVERLWLEREVGQGRTLDPAAVAAEFGIGIDHARQLLRDLRLAQELPTVADRHGDAWRDQAACLDEDPELFFPERGEWAKARQAKAVCQGCAVRGSCLHEALHGPQATNDETGIFGGTTPRERRGLRRRTWTGAPAAATRDRGLLVQALERARQVGREQAATELGISRVALTKAWERFGLEPPPRRVGGRVPPSCFYNDRAAAEAVLARAGEVGLSAAAREAGVSRIALDSAWRRWGLERPALSAGRRPGRSDPAPPLDDAFLVLNPHLAATLPRRASSQEVAARLRRLEELESLTPRVRLELHEENVPRPAAREFFIARRASQALEQARVAEVHQSAIDPAQERRRAAERLARAHARRIARQDGNRSLRARALDLGGAGAVTGLRGRDWRQLAACARPGVDPELFFPGSSEIGKTRQAKQICAGCAVKAPCLADALARPANADHGIYGGTTPRQRSQIRKEAQRGGRLRPSLMTDPGLAAEAFELARRIGTARAAQQLGVDRWRLYDAWDQWHLGRPNWRGRSLSSRHVLDPLAAQRAFQLAEQLGLDLEAVAVRLGINSSLLGDAWEYWGLGRPGVSAKAARGRVEPEVGDRTLHRNLDQATRLDVAEAATPRSARARSGSDQERER